MTYKVYAVALLATMICGLSSCVSNKKYLAAKSQASRDSLSLAAELAERDARLGQLSSKIDQMKASSDFTNSQLNQSQDEIAKQQQKLREQQEKMEQLQQLIDRQKAATEALRAKIADAMKGFSNDQLRVFSKNGKVYVSMQESLLFPSASATVNPKGKEALGTLAGALNQNPDINIIVEGHTDSMAIHTAKYPDNWALSVARSTAITRVLTEEYKVAPQRITASGRSQYEPVADNATPEGRAQNRRTEIILAPKLDELMGLIQG
ncbi:MAG: OmpA family protein [Bacteroidetes bacterium]|nr:OmpA family protein [Bacteroidota bacterium]